MLSVFLRWFFEIVERLRRRHNGGKKRRLPFDRLVSVSPNKACGRTVVTAPGRERDDLPIMVPRKSGQPLRTMRREDGGLWPTSVKPSSQLFARF
jgi:hypothetical protein